MPALDKKNETLTLAFIAPASVIHTIKWVNGLACQGFKVHLITQHLSTESIHSNVSVHLLPIKNGLGYIFNAVALNKLIKKISPDLINVHYASGYGTLANLSRIKPYSLSVWGSDVYEFPYKNSFNRMLIKSNLNQAKTIFSTSHAMAEQVRNLIGNNTKITITPFGVDMNRFKPSAAVFSSPKITIGIVKRLEHKYGIDVLIKSFAQVMSHYKKVNTTIADKLQLLIVGDGSKKNEYSTLVEEHELVPYCTFKSAIPNEEVPAVINTIDIFAVCSRIESFGVAAIEASACNRPCIVSNVGGLPEVVSNENTGIIVTSESVHEFSQAMIRLIDDPKMAIELGLQARTFVESQYSEPQALKTMSEALITQHMTKQ